MFGRGFGECVLCHVADGHWIAVDSFHGPSGKPMATEYLEQLGGDHSIQWVVITHWDDDHIHGMGKVVDRWSPGEIWLPAVLNDHELVAFAVEHDDAMTGVAPSGLRDFRNVMRLTKGRRVRRWGSAGHTMDTGGPTTVRLLAPTHDFIDKSLTVLGINHAAGDREVASIESNPTSIVLWITCGEARALLGADLEATEAGWTSVVDSHEASQGRAQTFKVPHHGSCDADEPRIWEEMLVDPINVTTRFTKLTHPLPLGRDVQRIVSKSGNFHVAGEIPSRLQHGADAFDLHLDAASQTGIRSFGKLGVVRLRSRPKGEWAFESFGAVESHSS